MLERLKARVEELTKIAEQNVQNHNSLIGSLQEVKYWVKILEDEALKASQAVVDEIKEVVGEVV